MAQFMAGFSDSVDVLDNLVLHWTKKSCSMWDNVILVDKAEAIILH